VIIMVGIYGVPGVTGAIFTPTEAAAVASVYAFLVASFVYRDMGPLKDGGSVLTKPHALITAFWHKDTMRTLTDAGKLIITLMFVIANALLLKHVITDEQIPQKITESVVSLWSHQAYWSSSRHWCSRLPWNWASTRFIWASLWW
jgi:C4-dicarboxylate transporter DctM subunit